MATYNKSNIFKAAWTMVRRYAITLAEALRKAWALAKSPKQEKYVQIEATVVRATDKAICLNVMYDTFKGRMFTNLWFPKTQINTENPTQVSTWILGQKNQEIKKTGVYGIVTL